MALDKKSEQTKRLLTDSLKRQMEQKPLNKISIREICDGCGVNRQSMQTTRNQYLGGDTSMSCSEQTQREIDRKVVELVRTEHERAHSLLTEHRALLDQLAQVLYEKETITGEEFMRILHAAQKEEEHHA